MTTPTFITFYAYKGGTGCTMALSHAALCLANLGHRVVVVDLDLAAPSLWPTLGGEQGKLPVPGVVEVMNDWLRGRPLGLSEYLRPIPLDSRASGCLFVLSAGMMDELYLESLEALDWSKLGAASSSAHQAEPAARTHFFDVLRRGLTGTATTVLLDVPTGFNDTANICMRLASDIVVPVFAPNRVQLEGVARVVGALAEEQDTRRRQGEPARPEVLGVVSTVASHRPSEALHRRIQAAFDYLEQVRQDALAHPESGEQTVARVERSPAVIGYDIALSELEEIDTRAPLEDLRGPYEDLLELLLVQIVAPAADSATGEPT